MREEKNCKKQQQIYGSEEKKEKIVTIYQQFSYLPSSEVKWNENKAGVGRGARDINNLKFHFFFGKRKKT